MGAVRRDESPQVVWLQAVRADRLQAGDTVLFDGIWVRVLAARRVRLGPRRLWARRRAFVVYLDLGGYVALTAPCGERVVRIGPSS